MSLLQDLTLPLPGLDLPPSARPELRNTTTFAGNMSLPIHRWFKYSAGFSAEWVERVVQDRQAKHVLDPFAGSGTSVLAAQAVGASSIGLDPHPFVARAAKAKLNWTADADAFVERAGAVLEHARSFKSVEPPASPLIEKCYSPGALQDLLAIREASRDLRKGDAIDELLWLALVGILRACSHVGTAQWQYVLPNKSKARVADPRYAFHAQVDMMARDMRQRQEGTSGSAAFYEDDARSCSPVPDGWADLVITSPPYANNFDYADATRLEMSFLGEITGWGDLKPLRQKLMRSCSQQMSGFDASTAIDNPLLEPIRAELETVYEELDAVRKTKGGAKAYHSMVLAYFLDSAQVFQALRRATSATASVCYVVGDSAPYGVHVPVERWLGELAISAGFRTWSFEKLRDRNVKWENRKHRVPLHEGRLWIEG